jgi:hypothetical protein
MNDEANRPVINALLRVILVSLPCVDPGRARGLGGLVVLQAPPSPWTQFLAVDAIILTRRKIRQQIRYSARRSNGIVGTFGPGWPEAVLRVPPRRCGAGGAAEVESKSKLFHQEANRATPQRTAAVRLRDRFGDAPAIGCCSPSDGQADPGRGRPEAAVKTVF